MSRPLFITDCDEVLLHFVVHFAEWVADTHGFTFDVTAPGFRDALRRSDGTPVAEAEIWPLLDRFFEGEMHRQNVAPGAAEALAEIARHAEIVVLTNIGDEFHAGRVEQLGRFDIAHRVICNRGGKGPPVAELVEALSPSSTVFVDDLPVHHQSVAKHAPAVWRLHMVAEPRLAARTPAAEHAHARIDDWNAALPWILDRLAAA